MKSTPEEIRQRFDNDVERFSDLNAGQQTAIDGALCLDLIASGAALMHPEASALLDVGCGAGNWTLKLLQKLPSLYCTLVDLSQPMLDRARERITTAGGRYVRCMQGDVRRLEFADGSFDIIVAGAVLHHLRAAEEWEGITDLFYRWLKPGGSVWVYDMIAHESPDVETQFRQHYFEYLVKLKNAAYAQNVFDYIEKEDTPWPLSFQMNQFRSAGFMTCDVLHKNGLFAAYAARR